MGYGPDKLLADIQDGFGSLKEFEDFIKHAGAQKLLTKQQIKDIWAAADVNNDQKVSGNEINTFQELPGVKPFIDGLKKLKRQEIMARQQAMEGGPDAVGLIMPNEGRRNQTTNSDEVVTNSAEVELLAREVFGGESRETNDAWQMPFVQELEIEHFAGVFLVLALIILMMCGFRKLNCN